MGLATILGTVYPLRGCNCMQQAIHNMFFIINNYQFHNRYGRRVKPVIQAASTPPVIFPPYIERTALRQ